MKALKYIEKVCILILVSSITAFSQTSNSTTQTVMFAVNRLVKPVLNISSSSGIVNPGSLSSETVALQDQLIQHSIKMTISVPQNTSIVGETTGSDASLEPAHRGSFTAASHTGFAGTQLDLKSLLQMEESNVLFKTPFILTVTE